MEEKIVFNTEDASTNRVFGILSYIGILFLVPIFAAKESPYARFHANQGLVLFLFTVAANIVIKICQVALIILPFVGSLFSILLHVIAAMITLAFMVVGIVNACSNEAKKLPIIGNITIFK